MNDKSLTTEAAAAKAQVSVKTIVRWITNGYRGKKLATERAGWQYRINPSTFDTFLWQTKQIPARGSVRVEEGANANA